ncbi:hypothetical protein HC928_24575 [bacterium]|nr:hypothetical protein [bacterium]
MYDPIRREIGYFYGGQGKRLSPVYLSSSIPPSNEETSEPLVPRRIELTRLPEREANRNIGAGVSNLESENSAQDCNPSQNPETSEWSFISIFDGLNALLEQFFRFIVGGGR